LYIGAPFPASVAAMTPPPSKAQLTALLALSKRLELAETYADVLAAARDTVREVVGYQTTWVYLFTPPSQYTLITIQGSAANAIATEVPILHIEGDPFLEEVVSGKGIVLVEDARTDPRTNKEIVAALGNRTIVNVPIRLFDRNLGTLGTGSFGDEGVMVPSREQLDFLDAVASHIAITLDRVRLLQERSQREARLALLFQAVEQSPVAVAVAGADGSVEYLNPPLATLLGHTAPAEDESPLDWESGRSAPEALKGVRRALDQGVEWRGELHLTKGRGGFVWGAVTLSPVRREGGTLSHWLWLIEDITERKSFEERLLRQSQFDTLTDLPNRVLAIDRLDQALNLAHRHKGGVAVAILDLDRFKTINDTLGHGRGDELLVQVAQCLREAVWEGDTVARLGGDEFLLILSGVYEATAAERVAAKVLRALGRPFLIEGREVFVTASLGITLAPADGLDPHTLLRNADAAMYGAKEQGGNTIRFFQPEMNRRAKERLDMEGLLRHAQERGEIALHYQPLVDAQGIPVGAEALMRWTSPDLGAVQPERFIPLAEETGLILPLGTWALEQACRDIAVWQTQGLPPFRVSVNVSWRQFAAGNLPETVQRVLNAAAIDPDLLELEITETLLMTDAPLVRSVLGRLKAMGVRAALDDFGTGYSSLSYLKRFPFDQLKIDQAFIRDLHESESQALVGAIIAMGRALGLTVVGEGVETEAQRDWLRQRGCTLMQGFLFATPMPATDLAAWWRGRIGPT